MAPEGFPIPGESYEVRAVMIASVNLICLFSDRKKSAVIFSEEVNLRAQKSPATSLHFLSSVCHSIFMVKQLPG